MSAESRIEIFGCGSDDRSYWCVEGDGAGAEGVVLGHGQVEGMYDAPVKVERKSSVRQRGGSIVAKTFGVRELSLGFHVIGRKHGAPASFAEIDSEFRAAFTYDAEETEWDEDWLPARIDWTTGMSGLRSLDVVLRDVPDFKPDINPLVNEYGNPILPLASDQPFWYQDELMKSWETSSTSASGWILMPGNFTDVPSYQRWVLTRGTWEIPDVSWRGRRGHRVPGGEDAARMVPTMPVTSLHGGLIIDLDPMQLMVRDAHDTNAIAQMPNPGQFFKYIIPPYTPPTWLPIAVTGAPAGGARAELYVPQLWSKPWGGEQPMSEAGAMPS